MSETAETIAIRVRRKLGLPESAALSLQPLVDVAIRRLAYDIARNSNVENYLQTNPATTTVTLDGSGTADLTALVANPRILLDCLKWGDIFPPAGYDSTQPFRLVDNLAQLRLAGAYDALVYHACLSGTSLFTRSPDNNLTPLAGIISFSVTYWPTIAQLPDSLVERLINHPFWLGQEVQRAAA